MEIVQSFSESLCNLQCGDCREWMSELVVLLLSLHPLSDREWRLFCSYKPIPSSVSSVEESCSVMFKFIAVNSFEEDDNSNKQ